MTTSVQTLSPGSQFQQLFSSVGSFFCSLCESTDSAFRRVQVMKRGEDGNIKFYDVKDKVTGEAKRTPLVTYIEDVRTGEMYLDEEGWNVSIKCALVALGMPFYTMGIMTWNLLKTSIQITFIASVYLAGVGLHFAQCRFKEGFSGLQAACIILPETLGNGLYEIIKAPFFGFSALLAGLYGIPKPLHGRKIEAIIEHAWQKGVSFRASFRGDFRNPSPPKEDGGLAACMKDMMQGHPLYLANCFQVRDNTNDPRVVVIRRDRL